MEAFAVRGRLLFRLEFHRPPVLMGCNFPARFERDPRTADFRQWTSSRADSSNGAAFAFFAAF
jgi:hypothetical protein